MKTKTSSLLHSCALGIAGLALAGAAPVYATLMYCGVTGPEVGAMGVHYINLALAGDGEVDATRPEAQIYEPSGDGMRLAGAE